MNVVAGNRVRPLAWVENLRNYWKCLSKSVEVDDFRRRSPNSCKIFGGAMVPYDVATFLYRNGFMNWKSQPYL